MNYKDAMETLIWNFRLDFDPVGICFICDETEKESLPVTHRSKARLSYCQYLAAARSAKHALYMEPEKLLCKNAQPVFGFRKLDRKIDEKNHLKYLLDPDLSWQAPQ